MRSAVLLIILALLAGCQKKAPTVTLSEAQRVEIAVAPHFIDFTPYPSDTLFRNLRKIADNRVCGEVNLKDPSDRYLGFAPFLDPMQQGVDPIIVMPLAVPPEGYRAVADHCMDDEQRAQLRRDIEEEQARATARANQAYSRSRSAMSSEQGLGYGGYSYPTTYRNYPDWASRTQDWRSPRPDWRYRRNAGIAKPITNFR